MQPATGQEASLGEPLSSKSLWGHETSLEGGNPERRGSGLKARVGPGMMR